MKKLKLDHGLAQMVLAGTKTSTWRLFDDKDLTVNDQVQLIDKVDPAAPQTWRVIGSGRINRIIEKRMGDITEADYDGHKPHDSAYARLEAYKGYYGERVTMDTPVKMVHFDFFPVAAQATGAVAEDVLANGQPQAAPPATEKPALIGEQVIVYADGGSRGNPGPSASGYIIMDQDENVLVDKGVYLGVTTNNQAEYQALKLALEEAVEMGAKNVSVRLDSLLVVNQMKGVFKVSNRELWPVHDAIKKLAAHFQHISYTHVPRELNKLADAAVNRALDDAARQTGAGPGPAGSRPGDTAKS